MTKKLVLSLMVLLGAVGINAQQIVIDPAMITTLVVNHTEQQGVLKDIKSAENNIRNFQILIQEKMRQIENLQEKTYKYLSTVNSVVKNGKDIIYASQIAQDIYKYQSQAIKYAADDPKLVLVAVKTESELISRTADLFLYIYNIALAGGEKNLLDNKQRIDLCIHVVNELRDMRGLAYSVYRQMKTAQRTGVLRSLSPGTFRYINNSKRNIDKILKDIQFIGKGGKY